MLLVFLVACRTSCVLLVFLVAVGLVVVGLVACISCYLYFLLCVTCISCVNLKLKNCLSLCLSDPGIEKASKTSRNRGVTSGGVTVYPKCPPNSEIF